MEVTLRNKNKIQNPMTGSAGPVSLLLGFFSGIFKLLTADNIQYAGVGGAVAVAAFIGLGSFIGQKSGGFVWKYKIEPWLKKIFKIK
jgi:hypothetical protein